MRCLGYRPFPPPVSKVAWNRAMPLVAKVAVVKGVLRLHVSLGVGKMFQD